MRGGVTGTSKEVEGFSSKTILDLFIILPESGAKGRSLELQLNHMGFRMRARCFTANAILL